MDTEGLATEFQSSIAPLMKLLKGDRLPEERKAQVIQLICERGSADDLAYIYEKAVAPDGYTGEVLQSALQGLENAARTTQVVPRGNLAGLDRFMTSGYRSQNPTVMRTAIRLAGIWKVTRLSGELQTIAHDEDYSMQLRREALDSLANIRPGLARETIRALISNRRPMATRYLGIASLARIDLGEAAALGAQILSGATVADDPAVLIRGFLERENGSNMLARALTETAISPDVAKLSLRTMYADGRSDVALSAVLSEAAGLSTEPISLSQSELDRLVSEVLSKGNPKRGEDIFRRADLSCMKCHAVGRAGGEVGPDLSALGSSSPVDYIVRSILDPEQSVKEDYEAVVLVTGQGDIHAGIVTDENQDRIVLRDAEGTQSIPTREIVRRQEGASLMPTGLTMFLTRPELLDLLRFLSSLGTPGDYAISSVPTIRRWRSMIRVPEDLVRNVPDIQSFRRNVLESTEDAWVPAYAQVSGFLPLDEIRSAPEPSVLVLKGEVDVTVAGEIGLEINSISGTQAWVDAHRLKQQQPFRIQLPRGRHQITLRINRKLRDTEDLRVQVLKVPGSKAEFTVLAGK